MAVETLEAVTDPVCGMRVEPGKAPALREVGDRAYWFCSTSCAETFDAHPERYVEPEPERRG